MMKINTIVKESLSSRFEPLLIEEIQKNGILKTAEKDQIILEIRRSVQFIPIIISGVVKTMRRDGKGNGILLHYLTDCETSALAVNFAQQNLKSRIRLKADSHITYINIPSNVVNLWFEKFETWRTYFLELNAWQQSMMIQKINDLAFEGLEVRLMRYLKETSEVYNHLEIQRTHFEMARDLKVSREAVSRILKQLERKGQLKIGRNKILIEPWN